MKHIVFLLAALSATFILAQAPDWHTVTKEDLLNKRGEIASRIQATQDESTLLSIWQRPDTDEAVLYLKMLASKRLGLYGTKAAVPVLVARLDNDKDGFFARYALETIPGGEVDAALCKALETIQKPEVLAGILTTLGVRGNAQSAAAVKPFLKHENVDVKKAAGYAYALTGGDEAVGFFTDKNLDVTVADSGFLLAEQFEKKGNKAHAIKIYDALAVANIQEYQKTAAVYHGTLARGLDGVDWFFKQLKPDSPDYLFNVALKVGRELPADEKATVAQELVKQFEKQQDPMRKALLVRSLGDRKDKESKVVALKFISTMQLAVQKFIMGNNPPTPHDVAVRVAAIDALRNVGNVSSVRILIEAATQTEEKAVADAAKNTLALLLGKEVDEAIVKLLDLDDPAAKVTVIGLVAERRIFVAAPTLIKLLQDSDSSVSNAAVSALGQIAGIEDLPVLLNLLCEVKSETEVQKLLVVLKSACTRFSQDAAATEVAKALDGASTELKTQLLDLLKEIAGAKSLTIVNDYAWGDDAAMRNVATRILGEWRSPPDLDQLAVACLKLAKESKEYKIRGLRGYIRLARQFSMPDERRLAMCKEVFELADRDDDRALIFDVFARVVSIPSLEQTMSYIDNAPLRERAAETAVVIGEKLQGKNPKTADAMKKVIEVSTNASVKERAQRVLGRQ